MKNILIYFLLLLNIIAALAIGISYISVFISPEIFWIPALFGMAYPYLFILNIVFLILWVIIKPKFMLLSIVAISVGYYQIGNYLQFSGKKTEEKGIRITSYNVKYFLGAAEFPNKENADHITNFLRQNNADIICLQEVRLNKRQIFDIKDTKLPQANHMQMAHNSNAGGQLTITVFPIVNMGEIRFKDTGNMIIFTDLLIKTDTVRVYNCHLESYRLGVAEINTIDSIDNFEYQQGTKKKLWGISLKFKYALIKRAAQAATLREHINSCPYPVIVCGDFNDTPVSFAYRTVKGNLKDSFIESGKGTANTYNGKVPSFRIDYILYSPEFASYNFEVSNLNHSDHYPVTCDLFPAEEKKE